MSPQPIPVPEPDWNAIGDAFREARRFLITTHVNPDGDGLGAELGLWAYLKSRGKDVRIVNPDPLPPRYAFLEELGHYESYTPAEHEAVIADRDIVVVLDISKWERLDGLGERLSRSDARTVCIDHHPFEANGMADLYAVDLKAAATGQLVYEMIRAWNHEVDPVMATGFYVSILTDTGSFRFSNSDARAHRVAAELISLGLDPNDLYEKVYGNSSLARIRLLGEALSTLRVELEGNVILLVLSREMMDRHGALASDTEGFVDIARTVQGSEGVGLLMERADGKIKTSLRSKGRISVNRIATRFGGGGHELASGATLEGPLDEAIGSLLAAFADEIARHGTRPAG
jgi:phosphoesterase RecJ-like protein